MTPKLLLADDSVTIQRVIELTFADEDVQVVAVGDGQQAIDRVQTDRPDIVLADVGMPERDGYEVAAFIKADPKLSHIPVLLLTGAFEPIDEVRARAVGCDGVLVKPFEPQMVISRVRDLLAGNRTAPAGAQKPTVAARPVPVSVAAPQAAPPAPPAPEPAGGSLEDYFDRLDAALASKGASAPVPTLQPAFVPAAPRVAPPAVPPQIKAVPSPSAVAPMPVLPVSVPPPVPSSEPVVRTDDLDLSGWDPSAPEEPPAPVAPPPNVAVAPPLAPAAPPPEPSDSLWQAHTLQDAFSALLAAEQGQAFAHPVTRLDPAATDVVDEIVRKVIARLGDDTMRAAVLDAAERLVREEIDRIKNAR